MKKMALFAIALLCLGAVATADSFTTFATRADQNPNDIIDWGQLGPDGTIVGSPAAVMSFNGVNATASIPGPFMGAFVEDCSPSCGLGSWQGNFEIGENLLYTGNQIGGGPGPLTISFGTGISTVGFQIQDKFPGAFSATLQAFDGSTLLFMLNMTGVSDSCACGSAIFMGIGDLTGPNITSIVISDQGTGDANDFAINAVSLGTATVPEPGSMGLVAGGLIALAGTLRRRFQ